MSKQAFAAAHRQALWEAYDRRCFYCRAPIRWDGLRIDHVVPEHLVRKPEELAVVLGKLGLPKGWDLNADHNLVAACDRCNSGKHALLPQPNQAILWLAQVERKVKKSRWLRQRYEREREADIVRAQLETALALKQISEREVADALVAYAAGEGAVQVTSGIEFLDGVNLSTGFGRMMLTICSTFL